MKTRTYYDRSFERWVTDIKTPTGQTCYMCLGITKYESESRSEFLLKALEQQIEISDLNIAHHEQRNELK